MSDRQFVEVEFRSGGRTYCYHNDGPPVHAGAVVKVPDRSGDGWQRATVASISSEEPAFATKAILGLVGELAGKRADRVILDDPFDHKTTPSASLDDLFAPR